MNNKPTPEQDQRLSNQASIFVHNLRIADYNPSALGYYAYYQGRFDEMQVITEYKPHGVITLSADGFIITPNHPYFGKSVHLWYEDMSSSPSFPSTSQLRAELDKYKEVLERYEGMESGFLAKQVLDEFRNK